MKKKNLIVSIIFFALFLIFTICIYFIDRSPIGPNNSLVGFALLNGWWAQLIGCNMTLYNITDWGGILPIAIAVVYAIIGLVQLIKRKSIKKVDKNILILGGFYILIFLIYMLFNYVVLNFRPVLINGYLEPSFPSSTTLMAITFMMLSNWQVNKYLENRKAKTIVITLSTLYMLFLVIGRIISGVHWITDIIASIMLSIAIIYLYIFICEDVLQLSNKD